MLVRLRWMALVAAALCGLKMLSIPMAGRILDLRFVYSAQDALQYLRALSPEEWARYRLHEELDLLFMLAYSLALAGFWRAGGRSGIFPWLGGSLDLIETSGILYMMFHLGDSRSEHVAWVVACATPVKYVCFYSTILLILKDRILGRTPPALERVDPPTEHAPGLWTLDSDWQGSSLRRRMTVVRLRDGSLCLHSPVALESELKSWLDSLGEVAWLIAPNRYHYSEVRWYLDHYPRARVMSSEKLQGFLSKKLGSNVEPLKDPLPEALASELLGLRMEGASRIEETVWLHPASRTLILTDLAFNMRQEAFSSAIERKVMNWNRVGNGEFGPSALFESYFCEDRSAFSKSLERILEWDFDRIIVSHGEIVQGGGREIFRKGFGPLILDQSKG